MKLICPILTFILTISSVVAQGKPILLIFTSNNCQPCLTFAREYVQDVNFNRVLTDSFDMRQWSTSTEEGRIQSQKYGILQVPAFIVINNGVAKKPIYGFRPNSSGKAVLLSQLGLMKDEAPPPPPELPLPPEVIYDNYTSDNSKAICADPKVIKELSNALGELRSDVNRSLALTESRTDNIIKDAKTKFDSITAAQKRTDDNLLKLSSSVERVSESQSSISTDVQKLAEAQSSVTGSIQKLSSSQNTVNTDIQKLATSVSTLNSAITKVYTSVENSSTEQTSKIGEINNTIAEVIGIKQPEAKPTGLIGTVLKLGVGAAATAFGWPIAGTAIGSTAAVWGLSKVWNRLKKNRHKHQSPHNPITDYDPNTHTNTSNPNQPTNYTPYVHPTLKKPPPESDTIRITETGGKTETKFVLKETDIIGESYKEALRKIASTMGEQNPAYKDMVAIIDHTANEILRGKRKPVSGSNEIKPETDVKLLWEDKLK